MRAQILKELDKTWLILEGEEPVPTENYQTRMLMGNMIPSILKVRLQQLDGRSRLCFDITSRPSLEEVCQDEVIGAGQIRMILESCLRAAEEMQEYLLDIDQLIIEPEYIFTAAGEKRQQQPLPIQAALRRFLCFLFPLPRTDPPLPSFLPLS